LTPPRVKSILRVLRIKDSTTLHVSGERIHHGRWLTLSDSVEPYKLTSSFRSAVFPRHHNNFFMLRGEIAAEKLLNPLFLSLQSAIGDFS